MTFDTAYKKTYNQGNIEPDLLELQNTGKIVKIGLYFKSKEVKTDAGVIFDDYISDNFLEFDYQQISIIDRDFNDDPSTIAKVQLYMTKALKNYERS